MPNGLPLKAISISLRNGRAQQLLQQTELPRASLLITRVAKTIQHCSRSFKVTVGKSPAKFRLAKGKEV